MKVTATSKDERVQTQKASLVADIVRGKTVDEALNLLRFMPWPAAKAVAKTIKSAAANAENNYQMLASDLKVISIDIGKGHVLKRFRPQARGRVAPMLRRSTNIAVVVAGEEE